MPKTLEAILAGLTPENADIIKSAQTAAVLAAEAAKDTAIEALTTDLAEAKKSATLVPVVTPVDKTETDLVATLKSINPLLAEQVEGLQKSVVLLMAEQADTLAKSRYDIVKSIPVPENDLKSVLKSASPAVYDILVKAAAAIDATVVKTAAGIAGEGTTFDTDANACYAALEKSAKTIMTAKTITFEAAFTQACSEDPATYAKYSKGVI